MNPEQLGRTAIRRIEQAAGPARDHWLVAHGLRADAAPPSDGSPEDRLLDACRIIASHGRLLEAGLAAGRDSGWLLHPGRGLRMNEIVAVAALLSGGLEWAVLRGRVAADPARHDVALALNLVCKTLDIPLGALALDRLELYAWKPRPGHWLLQRLARTSREPGWLERRFAGRRAS